MNVRTDAPWQEVTVLSVSVIVAIVIVFGLSTQQAAGQAQVGGTGQISPKVAEILKQLERGPSREEARTLLKNARLSKAEGQQLAAELAKLDTTGRLEMLKRRAKQESKLPITIPTPTTRTIPDLNQLRLAIRGEQSRKVEVLNRASSAAAGAVGSGDSTVGRASTQRATQHPTPRPQANTTVGSAQQLRSSVVIDRWLPVTLVVGQNLEITGSEFGAQTGEVNLAFRSGGPRGTTYPCPVTSWSETRIEITVPLAIEDLQRDFGEFTTGTEQGMLFVRRASEVRSAAKEVWVRLDSDRFVPQIYGTAPAEITPGSRVTITGRNLSLGREPRVTIDLPSTTARRQDLRVLRFDGHMIEAEMDAQLGGSVAGDATITVSNRFAHEGTTRIRFIPAEEVLEWQRSAYASCYSLLEEYLGIPGLCLWGEETRVSISRRAGNGFRLSGQRLESQPGGTGRSGCYFSSDLAQAPSGNISGEGTAWADAGGHITCRFYTILTGPRGVDP